MRSLNIDKTRWQNYPLADPKFNKPGRVDLIIGVDLYAKILKKGVIKMDGFWELEEECKEDLKSEICEKNFTKTRHIDSLGQYVVKMPFKEEQTLGESKGQGLARCLNLEKK